jgi:hypothetical protein
MSIEALLDMIHIVLQRVTEIVKTSSAEEASSSVVLLTIEELFESFDVCI